MTGIPANDPAESNNKTIGRLKQMSNNKAKIINFCSCRLFILLKNLKTLTKLRVLRRNPLKFNLHIHW